MIANVLTVDELAAFGRSRAGGARLTEAQARVLGALHWHAFSSAHCHPSQRLLAAESGLTREWVNRVCRELWRLGLICWAKAQRRGSRFAHNRYSLRHWRAPRRGPLLALLDRLRPRRLHTERTTGATEDDRKSLSEAFGLVRVRGPAPHAICRRCGTVLVPTATSCPCEVFR